VIHDLGAGNPQAGQPAFFIVTSMIIVEGLTVGSIMVFLRSTKAHVCSSESEVVANVAAMILFVALSHLIDGTQCALSCSSVIHKCYAHHFKLVTDSSNFMSLGVAQQCGCAYVTLGSYYLVEIPISVVSAFVLHMYESWTCVIHVGCVSDLPKKIY